MNKRQRITEWNLVKQADNSPGRSFLTSSDFEGTSSHKSINRKIKTMQESLTIQEKSKFSKINTENYRFIPIKM